MKTLATEAGAALFPGFGEVLVPVPGGEVFVRIGGSGPPLVLLHGYPQTSAMWHRLVPHLVGSFTVICPDLRGYGRSSKPPSTPDYASYSKRAMAGDIIALMDALGHGRFLVGAHDRGARVAHRMAADHPQRVRALALLDIAPTREMYANATSGFAQAYWHWYWLTQPAPLPETLIGADPRFFWKEKTKAGSAGLGIFDPVALEEYLACFENPDAIRASCDDYRAAWRIDIEHDDADGDVKIACPLQILWGEKGVIEAHFDALALWRERAADVSGKALPGGHFLAEELPELVAAEWLPFLAAAEA